MDTQGEPVRHSEMEFSALEDSSGFCESCSPWSSPQGKVRVDGDRNEAPEEGTAGVVVQTLSHSTRQQTSVGLRLACSPQSSWTAKAT